MLADILGPSCGPIGAAYLARPCVAYRTFRDDLLHWIDPPEESLLGVVKKSFSAAHRRSEMPRRLVLMTPQFSRMDTTAVMRTSLGMGKFQPSIAVALFLITTGFASAEPQPNQAEARRCSVIADDEKRLRCFDNLFSNKPSEPNAIGNTDQKSGWSIIEGTSPTDNSPQFSAGMVAGDAALILRCREQKTEAAFSTRDTYLGDESVTIRFRIDLQEPLKEVWRSSMNGRAAFAPHPVDFIRALPDSGRIFIRALSAEGNNKDANFQLAGLSEIREKIARACNWSSMSDDPTTGTIKPPQSR